VKITLWSSLLLLCIVAVFVLHAVYLNCVAEDAFITFRFAKNLASGHGLTWNIGEAPVEGYSNFLWLILCALALKLGFDLPLFAQVAGVLAGVATIVYTYQFARRLFDCGSILALIPCFFLAVSGPFAAWASSGMETSLFCLAVVAGCYYGASYWRFRTRRSLYFCSTALLVATLARPEGLMIFGIVLALSLAVAVGESKNLHRDFVLPALLYVVPFLIYFAWRWHYFGFLLPNTYYAKTGGTWNQYLRGAIYIAFFGAYFIGPLLPLLVARIWERGSLKNAETTDARSLSSRVRANFGVYLCAAVCLIYALYIVYVGGDYMAMYRFFVPILPLVYLLFAFVARDLFSAIALSLRKRIVAIGLLVFACVATGLQSTPLEEKLFEKPPFQHGHFRGVQTERWHVARLTLIGKFFDEYKRDADESLATGAIGAIGYYANMRVLDLNGIVDPHIAHQKPKRPSLGERLPGHEKEDLAYTFSEQPTYFMFDRNLSPRPLDYPNFGGSLDELVRDNYALSSVWLIDEINGEAGFLSFLERKRDFI
jgi:arabinofuranosyltransferase